MEDQHWATFDSGFLFLRSAHRWWRRRSETGTEVIPQDRIDAGKREHFVLVGKTDPIWTFAHFDSVSIVAVVRLLS